MQLLIFDTLKPVRFLRSLSGHIALKKFVVEFEEPSDKEPSGQIIRLSKPATINIMMDPDSIGLMDTREIQFDAGDYSIEDFNSRFKFLNVEINKSKSSISIPKKMKPVAHNFSGIFID